MRHWYVVKESYSDSLKKGDVIGFRQQNPNLTIIKDGHFVPSAEWIYIGRWDAPPIGDFIEAIKLIQEAEEMLAEIERLQEESEQLVALNTDHECPNAFDDWGNPIYILVSGHAGAGGQPRSWQITEERKVALRHLIAVNCPHGHCNAVEAIRAMLQEAGQ